MAVGQRSDLSFLDSVCKVETDRGRIKAGDDHSTSQDGIFAAGDVTTGPATVVRALAAGREAAVMMNRHMKGGLLPVETDVYKRQVL